MHVHTARTKLQHHVHKVKTAKEAARAEHRRLAAQARAAARQAATDAAAT